MSADREDKLKEAEKLRLDSSIMYRSAEIHKHVGNLDAWNASRSIATTYEEKAARLEAECVIPGDEWSHARKYVEKTAWLLSEDEVESIQDYAKYLQGRVAELEAD